MGRIDNTKGRVLVYCRGRRFAGPAGDVSGADAIRRFAEAYNEVGDERVGYAALCREILGVAPGAPLRRRSRFEAYEDRDTLWLKLLLDGGEDDAAVRAFLDPLVRVCEEFTFCPETEEFRGVYTVFRGVCREDGSVAWGRFRFDLRERGMFNGGFEDYERSVLGGGNAAGGADIRRRARAEQAQQRRCRSEYN